MDVQLKKWGNSLGLRIPHKIAESFGLDENSVLELTESNGTLTLKKKGVAPTLEELLASIPDDFHYPDDVSNFVESKPLGDEMI
jgi:antitoxin MazE